MYRRCGIPNEASLTALQILELTTQQYNVKKRKGSPSTTGFSGPNGHGKMKTAKSAPRRAVASKAKKA
jgi:pantothenate kinase-related protein Tda10